ncbi:MAG: Stp1/IreP family PP2C-type Ser/Thr phosphatase [Candidatus Zixiibacteriota bacterium]
MALQLKVAGRTDRGLVRPGNEDYLHLDEKNTVYAVCDGMGGHQAGEVASMTASATIRTLFNHFRNDLTGDERLAIEHRLPLSGDVLVKAIRLANRAVFQKAAFDPAMSGMGTTIVAAAFEDDLMSVAHVGDSRAYRLETKQLQPLTRDHSWVSELRETQDVREDDLMSMVSRNVITRALGVRETVEVDYRLMRVKPGDIFILCSDGLCGFADDDEIFSAANQVRDNVNRIVDDLIQMANDRGGSDNITVIAIEVQKVDQTDHSEIDVITFPEETEELVQAEDDWLSKLVIFKAQPSTEPTKRSSVNKWILTLIFIAFILAATAIIYFQGIK